METTMISDFFKKNRLLIKGGTISILILLLLIPTAFVENLIRERQDRQKAAVDEISSKWSAKQTLTGPVLAVPYEEIMPVKGGSENVTTERMIYVLPDKLHISASVNPEKRHRGIYEAMLYTADLTVTGQFSTTFIQQLKLQPSAIRWDGVYICINIADPKGLKKDFQLQWKDHTEELNPATISNSVMKEGFAAPVELSTRDTSIAFSTHLLLNGSEQLLFTPVGKETTVDLQSSWRNPSFTGSQLPETWQINDRGFTAHWNNLFYTRNFPQAWQQGAVDLSSASFGVSLFIPVNAYQKTMRSVKYAVFCLLLTFAAFFLIETTNKMRVHPVQYVLIGFALVLFYTLLLSLSEYIGFNAAYCISALATTLLITWFVKGLLKSSRLAILLMSIVILLYVYIFILLQLQDYALLLGSLGLFLMLAVIMHFSKKIQW
ncbi:MAG TPA: cell envelope integrity protein CreD [Chitinophagaceae bacterium]|nr:cell envelope integrity protein CreD [Chitinophagaceae bacterium]